MTLTVKKSIFVAAIIFALQFAAGTAQAALFECTGRNNECTICDFFAMVAAAIGFTLKVVVPLLLVLILAFGGLMMIYKKDDPEILERVKNIFKGLVIGALVAYGGWVLVTASLAGSGSFNKDSWWKFTLNCQYCGDGIVQSNEACDPGETAADCAARGGSEEECANAAGLCTDVCTIKETCDSPSVRSQAGKGCWLTQDASDANFCARGKYECDPETAELVCKLITPTVYDECCLDGGQKLSVPGASFDIVRAEILGPDVSIYTCDDVCAKKGEVCIGVGLTSVAFNKCVSVMHHVAGICDLSINLQSNNCHAQFVMIGGTCLENSRCQPAWEPCGVFSPMVDEGYYQRMGLENPGLVAGENYVQFVVGEAACYCR